jgi:peptidoglycan/xylan/chitin deacetylase (PgdA/CDA1 family)
MEDRRLRTIAPLARFMNLKWLSALSGQRTIFPFYHVVSNLQLPHIKHLYDYRNETEFVNDLEAMLRIFEPISIEDFLALDQVKGGKHRMVLSFDDGLAECSQFIAPLLKRKGIPAIFFLNNDFIDNRGLFFRYKASILIEHILKDRLLLIKAAKYLEIPEEKVKDAITMINYNQVPLLDALSFHLEIDFAVYMRDQPVYMTTEQVKHLVKLGFHLGAHSSDHSEFFRMEEKMMVAEVSKSMTDIMERFGMKFACFAFPFTSAGVPVRIIDEILEEGIADVVFGTAGLKRTGKRDFIQRIPMESNRLSANRLLKAEYLYYLMKAPLGRNDYLKADRDGV